MKKIVSIIVIVIMMFCLFSCVKTSNSFKIGFLRLNNVDEEKFDDMMNSKSNNAGGELSEKFKNVRHFWYDDLTVAILALEKGDIDRFVTNKSTGNYIKSHNPDKFLLFTDDMESMYSYAMATKVEDTDLLNKLNYAIDTLIKNGTLITLEGKYLNTTDIINDVSMPRYDGAATYKFVVTGDLPPMDYVSADGKPMGFNIALLAEISKILGVNIELIPASSGARKLMLSSGKADALFWIASTKSKYFDDEFKADLTEDLASTTVYNTQPMVYLTRNK